MAFVRTLVQSAAVHIAPSLKMSIYYQFSNNRIRERVDKSKVDNAVLKNKWESVQWTKKIK